MRGGGRKEGGEVEGERGEKGGEEEGERDEEGVGKEGREGKEGRREWEERNKMKERNGGYSGEIGECWGGTVERKGGREKDKVRVWEQQREKEEAKTWR